MGSLVPGWDGLAPGVPPKGYIDYADDDGGGAGYFAKLERAKSLRRTSLGGASSASSTGAAGIGIGLAAGPQTPVRAASLSQYYGADAFDAAVSPRAAAAYGASLPARFDSRTGMQPALLARNSLGRTSLGRTSSGGGGGYSFFDKMDSSALNARPDEEELPVGRRRSAAVAAAAAAVAAAAAAAAVPQAVCAGGDAAEAAL